MTNQNGYLSSKIKQIEHKVMQIQAENSAYLEKIEKINQQNRECLSAMKQNNRILTALSYNLTAIGEMALNMESNLVLIPSPENKGKKYDGVA